jgi:hypothetical protein
MKKELITQSFNQEDLLNYIKERVKTFSFTHTKSFNVDLSDFITEKTQDIPDISVQITPEAYIKMIKLVNGCDKEIAWHGYVHKEDNNYLIKDIVVYPQKITSVTVEADEQRYSDWLQKQGEKLNTLRFQGHSHVNMGVTPSLTDTTYFKDLLEQVNDYYIFIIVNKSHQINMRVYDKRQNVLFTEVPLKIKLENEDLSLDAWYILANENIITPTTVFTSPYKPPTYTHPYNHFYTVQEEINEFEQAHGIHKPK